MSLTAIAGLPITKAADQPTQVNMLIYGESGTGKTTLAGSSDSVPEMRKVLVIDIEGGVLSLKNRYPDVETIRVKTWESMQEVYNQLSVGDHEFNTIVIDSLSEAQKMSMDRIMRKLVEQYPEREETVPQIREWNINIEQTRKFVRLFRDLPVTTIFTALSREDRNPMRGTIRRKPFLSGKVSDEVAGFLDIVVYLYTKEVDEQLARVLLCGSTEDTVAKDRTDKLPFTIENPTMPMIWDLIKGTNLDAAERTA